MVADTGIFIEHLRAKNKLNTTLILQPKNIPISVTSVSVFELYIGASSKEKYNNVSVLIQELKILKFDEAAAIKAAQINTELKRQNKLIEFRDIFIAATCIVNNLPLLTLNKKHFERVDGLRLI